MSDPRSMDRWNETVNDYLHAHTNTSFPGNGSVARDSGFRHSTPPTTATAAPHGGDGVVEACSPPPRRPAKEACEDADEQDEARVAGCGRPPRSDLDADIHHTAPWHARHLEEEREEGVDAAARHALRPSTDESESERADSSFARTSQATVNDFARARPTAAFPHSGGSHRGASEDGCGQEDVEADLDAHNGRGRLQLFSPSVSPAFAGQGGSHAGGEHDSEAFARPEHVADEEDPASSKPRTPFGDVPRSSDAHSGRVGSTARERSDKESCATAAAVDGLSEAVCEGDVALTEQPTDMWGSPMLTPQTTLTMTHNGHSSFPSIPRGQAGEGSDEPFTSPIPKKPIVTPLLDSQRASPSAAAAAGWGSSDGSGPVTANSVVTRLAREATSMGSRADNSQPLPRHRVPPSVAAFSFLAASTSRASPLPRPVATTAPTQGSCTHRDPTCLDSCLDADASFASVATSEQQQQQQQQQRQREQAPSRCGTVEDGHERSWVFVDNGDGTGVLADATMRLDGSCVLGQTVLLAQSHQRLPRSREEEKTSVQAAGGASPVAVAPPDEPLPHQCRLHAYAAGETSAAAATAAEERFFAESVNAESMMSFSFSALLSPQPARVARLAFHDSRSPKTEDGVNDSIRRSAAPSRCAAESDSSVRLFMEEHGSPRPTGPRRSVVSCANSAATSMMLTAAGASRNTALEGSFSPSLSMSAAAVARGSTRRGPSVWLERSVNERGRLPVGGAAARGSQASRSHGGAAGAASPASPAPTRPLGMSLSCASPPNMTGSPVPLPPSTPSASSFAASPQRRTQRAPSPSRSVNMDDSLPQPRPHADQTDVSFDDGDGGGYSAASSVMVVMPDAVLTADDLAAQGWVPIRVDHARHARSPPPQPVMSAVSSPDFRPQPHDRTYFGDGCGGMSPLPRDPAGAEDGGGADVDRGSCERESSPARLDASSLFSASTLASINRRLSLSVSLPRARPRPSTITAVTAAGQGASAEAATTAQWDIPTPMGSVNMANFAASAYLGQTVLGEATGSVRRVAEDGASLPVPVAPGVEAAPTRREGSPSRCSNASSQPPCPHPQPPVHRVPDAAASAVMEQSDLLTSMSYERPSTAFTSSTTGYGEVAGADMSLPITSSSISVSMNPLGNRASRSDLFIITPQPRTAVAAPAQSRAPTFLTTVAATHAPYTGGGGGVSKKTVVTQRTGVANVAAHFRQQQQHQPPQSSRPMSRRDSNASMALYSVNASSFTCSTNTATNETASSSGGGGGGNMHRSFHTTFCRRAAAPAAAGTATAGLPLTRGQLATGAAAHPHARPRSNPSGPRSRQDGASVSDARSHTMEPAGEDPSRLGHHARPAPAAVKEESSEALLSEHAVPPQQPMERGSVQAAAAAAAAVIAASARFASTTQSTSSAEDTSASSASTWSITAGDSVNRGADKSAAGTAAQQQQQQQQQHKQILSALEHRVTLPPRRVTAEQPDTSVFLPWTPLTITPDASFDTGDARQSTTTSKTAPPSPGTAGPRTPDPSTPQGGGSPATAGSAATSSPGSNGGSAEKGQKETRKRKALMSSQALAALSNMMALAGADDRRDGARGGGLVAQHASTSAPPPQADASASDADAVAGREDENHPIESEDSPNHVDLIASYLLQQAAIAMARSGAPGRAPLGASSSFSRVASRSHGPHERLGRCPDRLDPTAADTMRRLEEDLALSLAATINANWEPSQTTTTTQAAMSTGVLATPAEPHPPPQTSILQATADEKENMPATSSPAALPLLPVVHKPATRSPSTGPREPSLTHRASSNAPQQ